MFPALPCITGAGFKCEDFLRLAEIGLALLLLTDTGRTELYILQSIANLPAMLGIGLCLGSPHRSPTLVGSSKPRGYESESL